MARFCAYYDGAIRAKGNVLYYWWWKLINLNYESKYTYPNRTKFLAESPDTLGFDSSPLLTQYRISVGCVNE
jgi:hypothetical protein